MISNEKIPLIVIVGPTASGKTNLAIELAIYFNTEIISADSMQIYKGLDIGTAKPDNFEMRGIPHHMINIAEPDTRYSVADYVRDAKRAILSIANSGKIPIIAGGTGLYIDSLISNTQFSEIAVDINLRNKLKEIAIEKGGEYLLQYLRSIDEKTAQKLHFNDHKRIIRAIEVYETTGLPLSEWERRSKAECPYNPFYIGLNCSNRQNLYDRINLRVDEMINKGLVDEVKSLLAKGVPTDSTSMQAIGYKEIIAFLKGELTFNEAVDKVKQETRRYAKRQLTWFRKNKDINWFYIDLEKLEEIYKNSKKMVENYFFL